MTLSVSAIDLLIRNGMLFVLLRHTVIGGCHSAVRVAAMSRKFWIEFVIRMLMGASLVSILFFILGLVLI